MIELIPVQPSEQTEFRQLAEAYWKELMPKAAVLKDSASRDRHFADSFRWEGEQDRPYWALRAGERVGFVTLSRNGQSAYIDDFYIVPGARRQGLGRRVLQAITARFDSECVTLIELSVRLDNPRGLAFWEAMGFRIASYRLRQYRDPATGTGFVGGLSSDFT
ncbi:MAG: GNAT family N-acetyltransferase [Caldilineaceae bacterium]|nr:GNAT family N-acetyltransferase [Caldilineaceae bacterium]